MGKMGHKKVNNHLQNGNLLDAPSEWPMLSRTRIDRLNSVGSDLHAKAAAHRRAGTHSAPKRKRMYREWGFQILSPGIPGSSFSSSLGKS